MESEGSLVLLAAVRTVVGWAVPAGWRKVVVQITRGWIGYHFSAVRSL
jgi:hypothetical protein